MLGSLLRRLKPRPGSQRVDVFFRPEGVYLVHRVGTTLTEWFPGGRFVDLGASPSAGELGSAVCRALGALSGPDPQTLEPGAERHDFTGTACLIVEREEADRARVTPCEIAGYPRALPEQSRTCGLRADEVGTLLLDMERGLPRPDGPPTDPDPPRSFPEDTCWLRFGARPAGELVEILGLRSPRPCNWQGAMERLERGGVFLTPAVGDTCFLVGELPVPSDEIPATDPCLLWLSDLSLRLGRVEYYCSLSRMGMVAWAWAEQGMVARAFASGEVHFSLGQATPVEVAFNFFDPTCPEAADDAYWQRQDLMHPEHRHVIEVAAAWGLDPSSLGETSTEPSGPGILGWLKPIEE